jgi:YbbR domain-containing protein
MLWFYVVGVENPVKEDTIEGVAVKLNGEETMYEDHSLVVTSDKNITVSLKVTGNVLDIARLKTRKDEIIAEASLSRISNPGVKSLAYDVKLPVEGVTLQQQLPIYVEVTVEKIQLRAIDVRIKNEGSISEGYVAEGFIIQPENLQISGPEDSIDKVEYAEAVWSRENVERTLSLDLEYKFYDAEGKEVSSKLITANEAFVKVTLPIKKIKEIPLKVEIQPGGGATEQDVIVSINPQSIVIEGEPEYIDKINEIKVGAVDLASIASMTEQIEYQFSLQNDVVNVSGVTECTVTVEFVGVEIKTFRCEDIELLNVPDTYDVELITKQLAVLVRGKPEELALVFEHNLRVVVDLAGQPLSVGTQYVRAEVYLDGRTQVGIINDDYKVAVSASLR